MAHTVNSLWVGESLTLLEKLTLKSFVDNGYIFKLWVYNDQIKEELPCNVELCDANKILPAERIFVYKNKGDCRGGSYGGFSDIFRYHLLYKEGGVYIDMDVTCLKPFDFDAQEYCLRPHRRCGVVCNIIKVPKLSAFMKSCIESTESVVNENNDTWILPVNIFAQQVCEYKLQRFIVPDRYFGVDDAEEIKNYKKQNYFKYKKMLPEYCMHWCRETSYGRWDVGQRYNWNKPQPFTVFYNLLLKHNLID
jgi:hypothetical protein